MTSAEHPTVGEAIDRAAARLRAAGVESPRLDARVLLGFAMDVDAGTLLPGSTRAVDGAAAARFSALVERRAAREPVAQIVGRREFYGRLFRVTRDVLDPRPDSEATVALALRSCPPVARPRLIDLGTGSGCLLLTLLAERPEASGLGVDLSAAALDVAAGNAARLGLADRAAFRRGSWLDGIEGPFDLVVANPPYIPSRVVATLAPEVTEHEPHLALDGGADGLEAYRAIIARLTAVLAPGGVAVFEVGEGQAQPVAKIAGRAGLQLCGTTPDLAGIERALALVTVP